MSFSYDIQEIMESAYNINCMSKKRKLLVNLVPNTKKLVKVQGRDLTRLLATPNFEKETELNDT